MLKVTVLYGHPESPEAFEKYYAETHLPLAAKMPGVSKVEATKFLSDPQGNKADYYRMAEIWYESEENMQASMASEEGQATVNDLGNFATGGVKVIIGAIG